MGNLEALQTFAAKREAERETSESSTALSWDSVIGKGGSDRDELMQMCAEVDLLALVAEDTGEPGRKSGDRYDFHKCPVCGHRDCFSYYASTNTWACFGGSNPNRKDGKVSTGGNVLDYLEHARGMDKKERVRWLRERTGHVRSPKPKDADQETANGQGDGFPPITQSRATDPPARAPVLIEGILRKGHTMLVTARSKAGKTFLMLELAVAVACGGRWLGRKCEQGRVLFVNPEVDPPSAENRLHDVADDMSVNLETVKCNVDFWHLRGHAQGIEGTARALLARAGSGEYALVILDSVYELYTGDENSADDAREFFHSVDRISKQLDCAVAMTHHHAKGIRSDLDALDRGSGSGVFGRKPDAPLDMTQVFPPNDDETSFGSGVTVWRVSDSGLREFPALEPFDVLFKYPRHILVADKATAEWKPKSGQQNGGRKTGEGNRQKAAARATRCELALAAEFIERGTAEAITATKAAEIVSERIGETVKAQTLKGYVEASELFDVEQTSQRRWSVAPKRKPPEPSPTLEISA